jgi:spoIIIJ-associated protein
MTIEELLKMIIQLSKFDLSYTIDPGPEYDQIELKGKDTSILLARNAEALKALEYLFNRIFEKSGRKFFLDSDGYRANRAEELRLMALTAADTVKQTGRAFKFNPMEPDERRILHMAVATDKEVRTESEGSGAKRQLVIYPC